MLKFQFPLIVAFLSFFSFLLLLVFILMDIFQYNAKVIVVGKYFQPGSLGTEEGRAAVPCLRRRGEKSIRKMGGRGVYGLSKLILWPCDLLMM